jgi:nucleotide-binding universal stress UspA family protein
MKRILFPTDFSEAAANALAYTVELAKVMDAKICLMHVSALSVDEAAKVHPHSIGDKIEKLKVDAMDILKNLATRYDHNLFEPLRVDYGLFVSQEIIDAARKENFDLIVMGTKGSQNPVERLMGSTTTNTMMNAGCPVLAIPEGATFKPIKRIAYATDFRPKDKHAVEKLMTFSRTIGASTSFVHVDPESTEEGIEDYALKGKQPFSDFSIVNNPSITDGLAAFIDKRDIQVLALFVPRRRLWERLFHTSVSKKLALHAHTPLLVFHE